MTLRFDCSASVLAPPRDLGKTRAAGVAIDA
jgi:hypothetical protein